MFQKETGFNERHTLNKNFGYPIIFNAPLLNYT